MASVNAPLLKQPFIQPKAVTASRTLTGTDSGTAWCNTNATASITFTLPLAAVGLTALATGVLFQFLVSSATETIVITPKTGDTIRGQTTSASLTLSTEGSFVQLECLTPGFWEVITGNVTGGGGGSGTVTSVGAANSDGLIVITGTNPVTTTGTIDFNLSSGAAADLALAATALQTVAVTDSITGNGTSGSPLELVNDSATPGNAQVYGTSAAGAKGWQTAVTGIGSNLQSFRLGGGTSQVYTVPPTANFLQVILVGGGGGGGSGAKVVSGACGGGGGGGGGGVSTAFFRAADLGTSVTITFSAGGGTGGAAQATSGLAGHNGTNGSNVDFGQRLFAYGGLLGLGGPAGSGSGTGGVGSTGNFSTGTAGGNGGSSGTPTGTAGTNQVSNPASFQPTGYANTGGGGGGGFPALAAANAGGAGGSNGGGNTFITLPGGAAGPGGSSGGNGTAGTGQQPASGGGGGGSAIGAASGGMGGLGGNFGGGGGGGGGCLSTGGSSGAGGNGGEAICIVVAW